MAPEYVQESLSSQSLTAHHRASYLSHPPITLTMGDYATSSLLPNGYTIDLSHHLSTEARDRVANPMKALWKVAQSRPHAISLANGDPHFSLYPMRRMEFEVPVIDSEDPVFAWRSGAGSSMKISTSTDPRSSVVPLQRGLGYTTGAGLPETQRVFGEITQLFHAPPNHEVTPTLGNCDGVSKCFRLLGDRGDNFLADEFSFSALTNAAVAHGVNWIPVKIDKGGMIPDEMERILREWKEEERGRRPHVLYTTPSGQNPTGSTLSLERRQQVYDIAQRYDIVIIEDDPYYFLQYDLSDIDPSTPNFARHYASSFLPSFLSMDVDGRVLRVDSFSKILAPGMRLGWITASPAFTERLVVLTDSSTMHPHGFGQLFTLELLGPNGWGQEGFARWLQSLCADYKHRRDAFLRLFHRLVDKKLARTSAPQAGMFYWIEVNLERHPRFKVIDELAGTALARTNEARLMDELFHFLVDAGVVLMPASIFSISENGKTSAGKSEQRLNFFRATFAGTEETVETGLTTFAKGLAKFFEA